MANEITIQCQLKVSNGGLQYANSPSQFFATQSTANGPSPGAVTVTTGGVTINLSQITTLGFVRVTNTDATNFVRIGLYISSVFYPMLKLKPLESSIFRLSSDVLTANTSAAVVRAVADTASCIIIFDAFAD